MMFPLFTFSILEIEAGRGRGHTLRCSTHTDTVPDNFDT